MVLIVALGITVQNRQDLYMQYLDKINEPTRIEIAVTGPFGRNFENLQNYPSINKVR